ncbi:hypothetical protein HC248_01535 [Polaromonas vacuolata]|uniref:Uncharacterized protein n=1 Tax=Polaromonas vacuolata TaxID=37448 RepID=A0A6H2H8W2_9BURK|nr:hypothetical protein HC248_01535 [Polaromonas vacuolata]
MLAYFVRFGERLAAKGVDKTISRVDTMNSLANDGLQ